MSNRRQSAAVVPPPQAPVRRSKRRWRLSIAIILAVLLGGRFAWPWGALVMARRAVAQRLPESALGWLSQAEVWSGPSAETAFLRARCLRRTGDSEGFRKAILLAHRLGYSTSALEREQTLLLAQLGRLREVEGQIARLFQTADDDAAEICEAYVTGLLLHFRQTEALIVLDTWAKDFPRDPLPWLIRGQVHRGVGRLADAEAAYRKACELAPGSLDYRQRLADLLLLAKKAEESLPIHRELTRDRAHRDYAWLQIAKAERLLGNLEAAREALANIGDASRLPPGDVELQRGLSALDQGDAAAALRELDAAKALQPRSIEVHSAVVQALRAAGRVDEARDAAAQLAERQTALSRADLLQEQVLTDPVNPEPRCEIGRILLEYGDESRGLVWLQSVLSLAPRHREANLALAEYHEARAADSPADAKLAEHYRSEAGPGPQAPARE